MNQDFLNVFGSERLEMSNIIFNFQCQFVEVCFDDTSGYSTNLAPLRVIFKGFILLKLQFIMKYHECKAWFTNSLLKTFVGKLKTRILTCSAFLSLGIVGNVSAQCPVLVGGTDFVDLSHSDTLWTGDFNLTEHNGPSGNQMSSALPHADSAQQFKMADELIYTITTNPNLLYDSLYHSIDKNMFVVKNKVENPTNPNVKFFSYKVNNLKKGSDFTVKYKIVNLVTDSSKCATSNPWAQWNIRVAVNPDAYGASENKDAFELPKPTNAAELTQYELKGTLGDAEDYLDFQVWPGYNLPECGAIGITDIEIYGCYKPKVISSQGLEICRGEQTLISLDKEYNAKSYEWFKSVNGGAFKSVGSSKSVYEQIKDEKADYFCMVNGVPSDTLHITTIICCVDDQGNPMSRMDVYYDDFGSFPDDHTYINRLGEVSTTPDEWSPLRADVTFKMPTEMQFDSKNDVGDGYYGVVVPTPVGYIKKDGQPATWMTGDGAITSDHTSKISGVVNGGALFMNVTMNFKGTIFSQRIDDLCTDKKIFFETYVANMSSGSDPIVKITIKDAVSGDVLAEEQVTPGKGAGWLRVHIDDLEITSSSVILEISSWGDNWSQGNDLIIDDIRFMVCSPPSVDAYSNLETFASDTTICADADITMGSQVSDLLASFFKNQQRYLYQQSKDGKTWQNISAVTEQYTYQFNTSDYPGETNYFRVVVATEDGLKRFLTNPSDADYEDKCRAYSISKPFKVIRAGAIDMGKDMEYAECGGTTLTLNGSNDGTLVKWGWMKGSEVLVPTTTDVDAKAYDYKVEDDAVITFVGYNAEGCKGQRKFTITKKNTTELVLDSVMDCAKTTVNAKATPSTAAYKWFYNGEELAETGASVEIDTTSGEGVMKAVASATGYCESDTVSIDLKIKKLPNPPRLIKSEDFETVKQNSSYPYVSMVKMSEPMQWAPSEDGPWSDEQATQPLDKPGVFHCYVRAVVNGCPSVPELLTITILETPVPEVRGDTICVGTKVDLGKYVTKTDDSYDLVWYDDPNGTGKSKINTFTANIAGTELNYWVTQKTNKAESEKRNIKVIVVAVPDPKPEKTSYEYCVNDPNVTELSATATSNEKRYIFATDVMWYKDAVDEANILADLTPSVATEGSTDYYVRSYYQTPNALNGELVCYGKEVKVTVDVIDAPAPTSTTSPAFTVNYLKTEGDATRSFEDVMTKSAGKVAITAGEDYSLVWFDENGDEMASAPVPPYDADQEEDKTYTYSVAQKNKLGCLSEKIPVTVIVNGTPAPIVVDSVICAGQTISLDGLVTTTEAGMQKLWYDSKEDATADVAAPAFTHDTPNKYTYWVSQKDNNTGAESRKVSFNVTVVGVLPPSLKIDTAFYCAGETNPKRLTEHAEMVKDEANYYYASKLVVMESQLAELDDEVNPNATIPLLYDRADTVLYYISQKYYPYAGDTKHYCEGEKIKTYVVTGVPGEIGGDKSVVYLITDASDNGDKFLDVLTQNPNVVVPAAGASLEWFEDAAGTKPVNGVPTPAYDPNQKGDKEIIYYVRQTSARGCVGPLEPVVVTISSSPMPTPNHVAYCEADDAAVALTAKVNVAGNGDKESDYSLVWYGTDNPNLLTKAEDKAKLEKSAAPVPTTTITDGSEKQIVYYYVAQKNAQGVVSRAVALADTIYASPVLSPAKPAAVCEPATVNLSSNEIWSGALRSNWKVTYTDKNNDVVTNSAAIAESGTFSVTASFQVNGKACVSAPASVEVTVDYIRDLAIDASSKTCPGTSLTLNAKNSGVSPATVDYTWKSSDNGDNTTVGTASYVTPALAGPADKTYTYHLTASAGACVDVDGGSHTVTIGDGPVEGPLVFSEKANKEADKSYAADANGVTFYSCGNTLSIDASGVVNPDKDMVWMKNGQEVAKGSSLQLDEPVLNGVYTVAYTNLCPTSFDITVVSVPLSAIDKTSSTEICEGNSFKSELSISCQENTYAIQWMKDGVVISGETSNVLEMTNPTPDDNGVYSYEITNRGCTAADKIAKGEPLKVKPMVKLNVQQEYVATRDSNLSIPVSFSVPNGTDPADMIWTTADGVPVGNGNPLTLTVRSDKDLVLTASDPNYCPATASVKVLMDAKLQLNASLASKICYGETTKLEVDTTGTGAFVYEDKHALYLEETVAGGTPNRIAASGEENGKLIFEVSPAESAEYKVVFNYRQGEGVDAQEMVWNQSLEVMPPVLFDVPVGLSLCGDGSTLKVAISSYTPAGTQFSWERDASILNSATGSEITISPDFNELDAAEDQTSFEKVYSVTASYDICQPVTKEVKVRIDRPISGQLVAPGLICEGDMATLDASSFQATSYSWISADDTVANGAASAVVSVSPSSSAAYQVEMTRGECSKSENWRLVVASNPVILSVDSISYNIRDIQVTRGQAPYLYWLDSDKDSADISSTFNKVAYGSHTAHVVDDNGCFANLDFVVLAPPIKIPNILSPNGDGVNDLFVAPVIREAYPDAVVKIFDRWGKLLATFKGEDMGWDGTYNGNAMPSTDYWYEIEVKELNKTFTGHFTLMRQ